MMGESELTSKAYDAPAGKEYWRWHDAPIDNN
jgi:hypothetical protein